MKTNFSKGEPIDFLTPNQVCNYQNGRNQLGKDGSIGNTIYAKTNNNTKKRLSIVLETPAIIK